VADAAMTIASSSDRRASAYIDSLWLQKKADDDQVRIIFRPYQLISVTCLLVWNLRCVYFQGRQNNQWWWEWIMIWN